MTHNKLKDFTNKHFPNGFDEDVAFELAAKEASKLFARGTAAYYEKAATHFCFWEMSCENDPILTTNK